MKTPRAVLLQRHEPMEARLDALRRNVVAGLAAPPATSWRDHVRAWRWHLAGLGAVWMAVLFLNVDERSGREPVVAENRIPPARVLFASILENRREIMELTAPEPPPETPVPPPKRSEYRRFTAMA